MTEGKSVASELENPTSGRLYTRRQFGKLAFVALGIAAIGGTGSLAYFAGSDERINNTSVAHNLNVRVVRNLDEEVDTSTLVAGQTIGMHPKVLNVKSDIGETVDGYLFAEVRVPCASVVTADSTGRLDNAGAHYQELFAYDENLKADESNTPGWVKLEEFDDAGTDIETSLDYYDRVRRYGWSAPVAPGEDEDAGTGPIFDGLIFANLVGSQGQEGVKLVSIVGYGIQSDTFGDDLWAAWLAFKKQNSITDGVDYEIAESAEVTFTVRFATDFAVKGEVYQLMVEGVVASTAAADGKGTVVFSEVPLIEGGEYTVVAEGTEVPLAGFVADEDVLALIDKTGTVELEAHMVSFAMFSETDESLRFYCRPDALVPEIGDTFEDLVATAVWDDEIVETPYDFLVNDKNLGLPAWSACANRALTVAFEDVFVPTSTRGWFAQFAKAETFDVSKLDLSACTGMAGMFYGCAAVRELKLDVDTSAVTDMSYLFAKCESLESVDIESFDTGAVIDMTAMFSGCTSLKTVDMANFDTKAVESMSEMFADCASVKALDASMLDTSAVTDMSYMFAGMKALKKLDVSFFDTKAVKDMSGMFSGLESAKELDLSSFNTKAVKTADEMFAGDEKLETIYVSKHWDMTSVKSSKGMFAGDIALVGEVGFVFDKKCVDSEYARIDTEEMPGYLTYREPAKTEEEKAAAADDVVVEDLGEVSESYIAVEDPVSDIESIDDTETPGQSEVV